MKIKPRQQQIIEAAGEILTLSGINGLTIKNLAAKIGFAESALYRHFKSKEEIILTMLKYLEEDMGERLLLSIKNIDEPGEQLKAIFNNHFDFFIKKPYFLVAIFSDGLLEESKAINEAIMQIMATGKKHFLQIIQKGQKQMKFNRLLSADELVHIIMGSLRLQILQWRLSGFAFDLKEKGNKLMDNILTLIKSQTNENHEK
ncbi:MAG: transcriptional regulator, TetR family [Ignavibacteria bacterium]|nr:transcriptional regulator, TetR family [Ignavibacteria bacterium]